MNSKQEEITVFVAQRFAEWDHCFGMRRCARSGPSGLIGNPRRPTPQELANELVNDTDFRALQLGTWLGTTQGRIITAAVEAVTPLFYEEDVILIVEALQIAAAQQKDQGRQRAAGIGFVALVGIIGLIVASGS